MRYTVSSAGWDGDFNINIEEVSPTNTKQIRNELDIMLGLAEKPVAPVVEAQYQDLSSFNAYKLDALRVAAKAFFYSVEGNVNLILTIKHIRSLTDGNLLMSKQLVEYAVGTKPAPDWWKF